MIGILLGYEERLGLFEGAYVGLYVIVGVIDGVMLGVRDILLF